MTRILVINPGSTSTKIAVYEGGRQVWAAVSTLKPDETAAFTHVNEQYATRKRHILNALRAAGISMRFDAVIARGGLLKPTRGGVYEVNAEMKADLWHAEMEHACNLGGILADDIARLCGSRALIADPEVVDELMPEARLTGIAGMERISIFHALNSKAVCRKYAGQVGKRYEDMDIIVAHLGGGISVGAHRRGRVVDVNNALNGDGPFAPERAGTLPALQFARMCFSGKYTFNEIKKLICGRGGLVSLLGDSDVKEAAQRAERGEEPHRSVLRAMMYNVSKSVGAMSVTLRGHVDAIILTGGIAFSKYCTDMLAERVGYLAPLVLMPGEDETGSLAANAFRALKGEAEILTYPAPLGDAAVK